jgi:hypothetical protein
MRRDPQSDDRGEDAAAGRLSDEQDGVDGVWGEAANDIQHEATATTVRACAAVCESALRENYPTLGYDGGLDIYICTYIRIYIYICIYIYIYIYISSRK